MLQLLVLVFWNFIMKAWAAVGEVVVQTIYYLLLNNILLLVVLPRGPRRLLFG